VIIKDGVIMLSEAYGIILYDLGQRRGVFLKAGDDDLRVCKWSSIVLF
jgi:hypothetical protein